MLRTDAEYGTMLEELSQYCESCCMAAAAISCRYKADSTCCKRIHFLVERRQLLQLEDDAEVEVADLLDWENWLHI